MTGEKLYNVKVVKGSVATDIPSPEAIQMRNRYVYEKGQIIKGVSGALLERLGNFVEVVMTESVPTPVESEECKAMGAGECTGMAGGPDRPECYAKCTSYSTEPLPPPGPLEEGLTPVAAELKDMTVDEILSDPKNTKRILLDEAEKLGITVDKRSNKKTIAAAITEDRD